MKINRFKLGLGCGVMFLFVLCASSFGDFNPLSEAGLEMFYDTAWVTTTLPPAAAASILNPRTSITDQGVMILGFPGGSATDAYGWAAGARDYQLISNIAIEATAKDLFRFYEVKVITKASDPGYDSTESFAPDNNEGARFAIQLKAEGTPVLNVLRITATNTSASTSPPGGFSYPNFGATIAQNGTIWMAEEDNKYFPLQRNSTLQPVTNKLTFPIMVEGLVRGYSANVNTESGYSRSARWHVPGQTASSPVWFYYNHQESSGKHTLTFVTSSASTGGVSYRTFDLTYTKSGSEVSRLGDADAKKEFIIDHPIKKDRYLVHTMIEGPYNTVFYRGTSTLKNGRAVIQLPDYFEALTHLEGRAVFLNAPYHFDSVYVETQANAQVKDGAFIVRSSTIDKAIEFHWEVLAKRKDVPELNVEPLKSDITVKGFGPYKYYQSKHQ